MVSQQLSPEALTAKDFRTWWGTVLALHHLRSTLTKKDGIPAKKLLTAAITLTAESLGHTRAVCQQSYIHPGLLSAAESGGLVDLLRKHKQVTASPTAELTQDEALLLAIRPESKL